MGKNGDITKSINLDISLDELETDPGLRIPISEYNPNIRDEVRRKYLLRGSCQPRNHDFSLTQFGKQSRKFSSAWFDKYANWLEYSIAKDAAFCLCCYLFKPSIGEQAGGDSFVGKGFSNFKKQDRLQIHIGGLTSAHNQAWKKCQALKNQNQHIQSFYLKQSEQDRRLAFRGDDKFEMSSNRGNFLELLQYTADQNHVVKAITLKNAPENLKLTSPDIQKEIVSDAAAETIDVIIKDIGDSLFSVIVDESRDISVKEQMAVVLLYVDKKGQVIERFVGIEHVANTTAPSLKAAIDKLFSRYGLSLCRLRGQGYDGASNLQGEFNGLKALILKENPYAFYVHCFAHQLQLFLVSVAKKQPQVASLFILITSVVNIVGASSKHCDILRGKQYDKIAEALESGEILSGRGLNQEISLKRPGDTRWGSHYGTLISLIALFSSVIDVLAIVANDGANSEQRFEANNLLQLMLTFEFVFSLHLMKTLLGITNELSKALQRKDQDIVNAMNLVKICKQRLQLMKDDGWDSIFSQVSTFCGIHEILIPNTDDTFVAQGRSRRKSPKVTNLHHFRVDIFYSVIDMQLQELNYRFNDVNTDLLLCVACLCPNDSFAAFDKKRLIYFADYYLKDISTIELLVLSDQLETYIADMLSSNVFLELKSIGDLAQTLVQTRKNDVYSLVYRLVTLSLLLPIVTATVERAFSAMNVVKNQLRNRMEDQWMNDILLVYIERDIFNKLDNELIMQRFQSMKTRRGKL
ncbi:hypothetical protein UlMin_033326 [Ulmus minor]